MDQSSDNIFQATTLLKQQQILSNNTLSVDDRRSSIVTLTPWSISQSQAPPAVSPPALHSEASAN